VADPGPALRARIERAVGSYERAFGCAPRWVGWGPGRVNIIGEHTDYNAGLAMPAAIDRWVVVALDRRAGGGLEVHSEDFDERMVLDDGAPLSERAPSWQRFARGCVVEYAARTAGVGGWRAAVAGDVPLGAGLSSSAALEMAWLNALDLACEGGLSGLELARVGQQVEHRHLGLASGLLDQLASQLSRPGELMVVDFDTMAVRYRQAALPGWTWLVVDSGVRRELAGSAYRERVAECARGLRAARALDGALEGFRGLGAGHLEGLREAGHALPALRLGHLLSENRRVVAMELALSAGDAAEAGRVLDASHASLRDDYAVSCVELDLLAEGCSAHPGCAGARMVGGGFGGCVLALVRIDAHRELVEDLAREYGRRTPHQLRSWRFRTVGGAGALRLGT